MQVREVATCEAHEIGRNTWFLPTSLDITPKGSLGSKQSSCVGKYNQLDRWFHLFILCTKLGRWFPIWRACFFNGLVQPPSRSGRSNIFWLYGTYRRWQAETFFCWHWWQEQTMTRLVKSQLIQNVDWNIGCNSLNNLCPRIQQPGCYPLNICVASHQALVWSWVWVEIIWLSKSRGLDTLEQLIRRELKEITV